MDFCILCFNEVEKSKIIEISKEISKNFTIIDAIMKYFQCSNIILQQSMKLICSNCYDILKAFHEFSATVNDNYKKLQSSISYNDIDDSNRTSLNVFSIQKLSIDKVSNVFNVGTAIASDNFHQSESFEGTEDDLIEIIYEEHLEDDENDDEHNFLSNKFENDQKISNSDENLQNNLKVDENEAKNDCVKENLNENHNHRKVVEDSFGNLQENAEDLENSYDQSLDKDKNIEIYQNERLKYENLHVSKMDKEMKVKNTKISLQINEKISLEAFKSQNLSNFKEKFRKITKTLDKNDDLKNEIKISIKNQQNDQISNFSSKILQNLIKTPPAIQLNNPLRRKHPAKDFDGDEKIKNFCDIKCQNCEIDFNTFSNLIKHFRVCHPNERGFLICCGKKFTQRSLLLDHLEYHDKSKVHKCDECRKDFKSRAILKSHLKKFHSDDFKAENSTCEECGKNFTNKYILKTHMRQHAVDSDKSFECYICKKSSKNFDLLVKHFKYKHDPNHSKLSVCHICSKIVTRLDIHLRQIHAAEPVERVKCDICNHWIKKISIKSHVNGHSEGSFSCRICGKSLKNKNSLFCHMKRIHTEGKFQCSHCDKKFHQNNQLIDHIACQHTGTFLHQCRINGCGKMFRNAGRRRIHERRMHPSEYEMNLKPIYLREHLNV